eukprot:1150606-Pelagomonas_calceolata.AAC.4
MVAEANALLAGVNAEVRVEGKEKQGEGARRGCRGSPCKVLLKRLRALLPLLTRVKSRSGASSEQTCSGACTACCCCCRKVEGSEVGRQAGASGAGTKSCA